MSQPSLDSKNGDMIMNLLQNCQTVLKRTIILVNNITFKQWQTNYYIQDGNVTEQQDESITKTANTYVLQMKQRIDRLAKAKEGMN